MILLSGRMATCFFLFLSEDSYCEIVDPSYTFSEFTYHGRYTLKTESLVIQQFMTKHNNLIWILIKRYLSTAFGILCRTAYGVWYIYIMHVDMKQMLLCFSCLWICTKYVDQNQYMCLSLTWFKNIVLISVVNPSHDARTYIFIQELLSSLRIFFI